MRSYPVPVTLQEELQATALRASAVEPVAHDRYSSPEARAWAWRILDTETTLTDRALTACGFEPEHGYYGILDPEHDEPLVIAVVSVDPEEGMLRRWNGSGWDLVPDEMEPEGYGFIEIGPEDLPGTLDVIGGGGALLLRATQPKAKYARGSIVSAGEMQETSDVAAVFAVVDDFDSSAVLDIFQVENGRVLRRIDGEWTSAPALLGRLRSVDPPTIKRVLPENVDRVVSQVDAFDDSEGLTAAAQQKAPKDPEFEKLHPREGGKFTKKQTTADERAAEIEAFIRNGGKPPKGIKMPTKKEKKGRAARKSRATKDPRQTAAENALRNKWAAEDARAMDRDAKYDIARAKSDLAETRRRDMVADQLQAAYDQANAKYANDPARLQREVEKIQAQGRTESLAQKKYDRAAKYERMSETIRRQERRRATQAMRVMERARLLRKWKTSRIGTKRAVGSNPKSYKVREVDPLTSAGTNPPATTRMPGDLKTYWARGKGAAKIRWGTGGDFNRCRRQLRKYLRPDQVPGACANLHKIATGTWPGKGRKHGVRAAAYNGNGTMVAFPLPLDVAKRLAVPDGIEPEDMHVTLAYLGEDVDPAVIEVADGIAAALALEYNGLDATLSGRGEFLDDDGDVEVSYASVDCPNIEALWADLTDRLHRAGVEISTEHGFTPHVTLTYGSLDDSEWPDLPTEVRLGTIQRRTSAADQQSWDLLP